MTGKVRGNTLPDKIFVQPVTRGKAVSMTLLDKVLIWELILMLYLAQQ
jgi:hypothetical protein